MKQPLNMIADLNYAWNKKNECSVEEFENKFRNLLSHAYADMEKEIMSFYEKKGEKYDDLFFYSIQELLIYFMYADNGLIRQEYNAYQKYCEWANFNALSPDELLEGYKKISKDTIVSDLKLIAAMREGIDGGKYNAFVVALAFFCLMGDKELDENEYYLLSCFYEKGYDTFPLTWEDLKKQW